MIFSLEKKNCLVLATDPATYGRGQKFFQAGIVMADSSTSQYGDFNLKSAISHHGLLE